MHIAQETIDFVVILFYRMEEKWRNQFETILRDRKGVSLHRAFWQLRRAGCLGKFDSNEFSFDPLYQVVTGLNYIMTVASRHSMIRLDGSSLGYYLDTLDEKMIEVMIHEYSIPEEILNKAVGQLNLLLQTQESKLRKNLESPTTV